MLQRKPYLYWYQPCQEDLRIGGSDQSPCLRHSQHEGVEAQHRLKERLAPTATDSIALP
jgi:hypothetical protein